MVINDSTSPKKIVHNTSDPLLATISVVSENSMSTLTPHCDIPTLSLPNNYPHIKGHVIVGNT